MSRVEILKSDGCGEVMPNVPTRGRATLIVYNIESEEKLDICPGCAASMKRFLQDHRMPVCDAPVPPKPAPHRPGKRREAARGVVFKPGKPLNPVPADEPKDGES